MSWHLEMEEKMREKEEILLGKVRMRMTPSAGETMSTPDSSCAVPGVTVTFLLGSLSPERLNLEFQG